MMFLVVIKSLLLVIVAFSCVHLVHGYYYKSLNQTHFWNNRLLTAAEKNLLDTANMVSAPADPYATRRLGRFDLRFHMPLFGGWKEYVVLTPEQHLEPWYVGWWPNGGSPGRSLIPLTAPVRVLRGPDPTEFFGFDAYGKQIKLRKFGTGTLGQGGRFASLPLL